MYHAWGWQYQHNLDNMLRTFSSSWICVCTLSSLNIPSQDKIMHFNQTQEILNNCGVERLWWENGALPRLVLKLYFSVFPRNWRDNNVQKRRSQCASFYLRIGTVCQYFIINPLGIFIFPLSVWNWEPHTHWNRNWWQLWGRFLRWSRLLSRHRNSIAIQPPNGMKYFFNSNFVK